MSPQAVAASATPAVPGGPPGYTLDWERSADRVLPIRPADWAIEYAPSTHQVRAAAAPGEPVRYGQHSVRFELHRGDKRINCGVRCELSVDPPEPAHVERWYGFSVYLPYTWVKDRSPEAVAQWHQVTEPGSPPLAILTKDGQWVISQRDWSNVGSNNTIDTKVGPHTPPGGGGWWTDWVVHVVWAGGSTGLLQIWKNGVPVPGFAHKTGRTTFSNSTRHYMKIGIYKWHWNAAAPQAPGCPAPQPDISQTNRRVLYHDELHIADGRGGYAAVAPRGTRPAPVPPPP